MVSERGVDRGVRKSAVHLIHTTSEPPKWRPGVHRQLGVDMSLIQ